MDETRIKVALKVRDAIHLTQLNVGQSLEEVIRGICDANGIRYERGAFAIKIQDFCKIFGTEYVTEDNKKELRHGRQLKLSKSPAEKARKLIDRLHKSGDPESSMSNLKNIANASRDSVMLMELHRRNLLQHLRVYASVRNLSEHEHYRIYKVMGRFLARGYIKALCEDEVNHLTDMITGEKKMTREMLLLAFEILILLRKKGKLYWPTRLLRKLTPYVRLHDEIKLQEKSLQFINTLYVEANDEEERRTVFDFMKSPVMITYINKYVIREGLSDAVKHQLSLYQKIILGKYKKQLETVAVGEEKILENFEYVMSNISLVNQVREMRITRGETQQTERWKETENRSDAAQKMLRSLRLSLTPAGRRRTSSASTDCARLPESDYENEFLTRKIEQRGQLNRVLSVESVDADQDEDEPDCCADGEVDSSLQQGRNRTSRASGDRCTVLARDNLYYFVLNDYKGFEKLMLNENGQLKSILRTSIDVCQLLCKIFAITKNESKTRRGRFVPLCFLYYDYIIERMFCVAMKLYHRSRREMRVAVDGSDHSAVLKMVEDQLTMALELEPLEFVELEERLKVFTVDEVMRKREETAREEVKWQLTKEPAFVELKEIVTPRIMNLIREKRLRFMEGGEHVHQFDYKGQKIPGKWWFLHLSKIHDEMTIEECTWDPCRGEHRPIETVQISNIREVESGRKSNFHKEVYYNLHNERDVFFRSGIKQQEPELEFPISLKLHKLIFVDFCAGSQLTMDYWVDGLRFLVGERMNSRRTEEELEYLMDLELMEHLAGIEGITISKKAPAVPPPPPNYHFATD